MRELPDRRNSFRYFFRVTLRVGGQDYFRNSFDGNNLWADGNFKQAVLEAHAITSASLSDKIDSMQGLRRNGMSFSMPFHQGFL